MNSKVKGIFWGLVGAIVLSFGAAVYTAVTHPVEEGPVLQKATPASSVPVPAH
ncbi:MAG TPA: hypothetical protein VL588_05300 [Bdellovibrionota bacterium]|nr:hypothetical protein [Bdellovibrionota bacterium]